MMRRFNWRVGWTIMMLLLFHLNKLLNGLRQSWTWALGYQNFEINNKRNFSEQVDVQSKQNLKSSSEWRIAKWFAIFMPYNFSSGCIVFTVSVVIDNFLCSRNEMLLCALLKKLLIYGCRYGNTCEYWQQ